MAATALMLTACERVYESPAASGDATRLVTFNLGGGGFGSPTFTRAISLGESDMTDLWVFDFVAEECVQSLHLTPEDAAFSNPQLTMSMGEHEVCFFGPMERIRISHSAENRAVFARGAVRAAAFLADKPAGLYDMKDLTG